MDEKITLFLEQRAAEKLWAYTMLCKTEISGLGKVTVVEGNIVVSDLAIFDQKVSSAHSTIPAEALAKFQDERVKAGESMKEWCLWWHSHAEMGVFFSGTDTATIDESSMFPYLVSLVVNRKRETKARLDIYTPVRRHFDMDVRELLPENKEILDLCQKDIDDKVRPATELIESKWTGYQTYSPSQERDYDHKDSDLPRKYNTMTDEEVAQEYRDQKRFLTKQIQYLRTKRQRKYRTALQSRIMELKELVTWGKSTGMEVGKQ